MNPRNQRQAKVLPGIQYLRFLAAMLVVARHNWMMIPHVGSGDLGWSFEGGQSGVDIFFVISGFMMVYISDRSGAVRPWGFALDRFIRIAPPYWLATLAMAAVAVVAPSLLKSARPDLLQLITSLIFLPWPHPNPTMGTMPLLAIGWTLNYEMMFYMLFAAAMLLSPSRRVLVCSLLIAAMVATGLASPARGNPWLEFYTHSLMLEFILGMLVALVAPRIAMPGWLVALLLAAASMWFAWSIQQPFGRLDQTRWLMIGLPSAAIVLLVVTADLAHQTRPVGWLLTLGNASYAIYIVHLFPLAVIRAIWPLLPAPFRHSDLPLLTLGFVASVTAAIVFHLWMELPIMAMIRGWFGRRTEVVSPETTRGSKV